MKKAIQRRQPVEQWSYGEVLRRHRTEEPDALSSPVASADSLLELMAELDAESRKTESRQMPYEAYMQTEHWRITRRAALARAGHRCERCAADSWLNVHHRTYENLGAEEEEDLEVLCRSCHEKEHGIS